MSEDSRVLELIEGLRKEDWKNLTYEEILVKADLDLQGIDYLGNYMDRFDDYSHLQENLDLIKVMDSDIFRRTESRAEELGEEIAREMILRLKAKEGSGLVNRDEVEWKLRRELMELSDASERMIQEDWGRTPFLCEYEAKDMDVEPYDPIFNDLFYPLIYMHRKLGYDDFREAGLPEETAEDMEEGLRQFYHTLFTNQRLQKRLDILYSKIRGEVKEFIEKTDSIRQCYLPLEDFWDDIKDRPVENREKMRAYSERFDSQRPGIKVIREVGEYFGRF